MRTKQNSTNIDWGNYDNNGWCPGCDFCKECNCAHEVGRNHHCAKQPRRERVRLVFNSKGFTETMPSSFGPSILLEGYKVAVSMGCLVGPKR